MAKGFDQWYADMAESPRKDEIVQRHLGLPAELLSSSLLPWEDIADVADALALLPGQLLVDLACGRGGYGLELAARTGARLLGIDFSAEAVRQAHELARRWNVEVDFKVGDLTATGLADESADAIVVVDAIQFPVTLPPPTPNWPGSSDRVAVSSSRAGRRWTPRTRPFVNGCAASVLKVD